jgi:hypothetical protein
LVAGCIPSVYIFIAEEKRENDDNDSYWCFKRTCFDQIHWSLSLSTDQQTNNMKQLQIAIENESKVKLFLELPHPK